jgi:hypothetical protein
MPLTLGLPERVVQTVVTEGPGRLRRNRLMSRLRAPLSLVALFALIAIVVAVFVGERIVQDWNSFHNASPAGSSRQLEILGLESRPLHIPAVRSPIDCVSGPFKTGGASFGSGPVYGDGGAWISTSWGTYFHNRAYADTQIRGLVLIRALDLYSRQAVVFVGQNTIGPVIGTDTINGKVVQQHTELLLDPGSPSRNLEPQFAQDPHKYTWVFTAGLPTRSSGSTAWQIDGPGFTEVFLAC